MAIKVGINGFGRIGRVVLRIMSEHPEKFDICGINLRKADLDYMVYLVKYDSVFRQFNGTVEQDGENRRLRHHRKGLRALCRRREEGHSDRARQGRRNPHVRHGRQP